MFAYLAELSGWAAAAASLYAFHSKTMIPLRYATIAANILGIIYSAYSENMASLVANAILLPLNILRLREMLRLISDVRRASRGDLDFEWLKPFMRATTCGAGEQIFRRGDVADAAYVIAEGQVSLPELGVILGPGSLFGEMGLFASGGQRMASAIAMGDVRLYRISYDSFEQLYFQNPEFGLYLVRLMVRRMENNLERLSGRRRGSTGSPSEAPQ